MFQDPCSTHNTRSLSFPPSMPRLPTPVLSHKFPSSCLSNTSTVIPFTHHAYSVFCTSLLSHRRTCVLLSTSVLLLLLLSSTYAPFTPANNNTCTDLWTRPTRFSCIHLSPFSFSSLHLPFFLPPRHTCSPKSAHLRAFACHVKNNRLLHHATACLQLCTPVLPFKIVPTHPSYLQLSLPYLSISTPVLPHICTTNLYSYCTSHLSIFSPTPVLSTIFPLHLKCQLFSTLRLSRHILFPLHLFSRHICPPIQLFFPDHFFFLSRARLCLSRRVTR